MTFVLATRNRHKIEEIRSILGSGLEYYGLADFPDAPGLIEDRDTFAGNALAKAVQLAAWPGLRAPGSPVCGKWAEGSVFVLADDSGLEVDVLGGAPGVYSARFAAADNTARQNTSDAENNAKLLRLLEGVPLERRRARFRCVIARTPILEDRSLASPVCLLNEAELETELYEGACEGTIALEASGRGGFGYDPLFIPAGFSRSFAELTEGEKNRVSHRAKALERLKEALR